MMIGGRGMDVVAEDDFRMIDTHVTLLPLWVIIEYQMTKVFYVLFHMIVTFGNRIVDRKYPALRIFVEAI